MNRMALLCSLSVVGLTAAALIEHREETVAAATRATSEGAPRETTTAPARVDAPPRTTEPEVRRTVDVSRLRAHVQQHIIKPLETSFLDRVRFSRVRQPSRTLHLEMKPPTEERAPREDAQEFVYFEIEQGGGRLRPRGTRLPFLHGRMALASGQVELTRAVRGVSQNQPHAWKPAAEFLRAMGVEPGAPAQVAKVKRRPW